MTRKKIRGALRVASLFAAYSAVGAGGEYVAGLLAEDPAPGAAGERRERVVPRHADGRDDGPADVAAAVHSGGACAYEAEREMSLPVSGAGLLSIEAGSGELAVEGRDGLAEVVVTARVCASHEAYVEQLRVTLERMGDEIVLTAHYPESRAEGGHSTARIDLGVQMPVGMSVDVDDASGSMDLLGTGALRIDDSSGSIRVVGAEGSVRIEDSSGSLEVREVAGDVQIRDGSGEIDVRDVTGSVRVRDGSGGIDVADVDSDVVIEDDGSGGIAVRGVGGDFVVEDDGSGGIRYDDVAGRVDVPSDERRRGRR